MDASSPGSRPDSTTNVPEFLRHLTGAQKSAYLILSLPGDQASEILRHLDEDSLVRISGELSQLRQISAEQKREVLQYFQRSIRHLDPLSAPGRGGTDTARELLEKTFGGEKANEILKKLNKADLNQDFEYLNQVESRTLASLLTPEHPQTIAIALANLLPRKSAQILKSLPEKMQQDVTRRLATTTEIHPDAVANLAAVLRQRLERNKDDSYQVSGGVETLANILNHMDRTGEEFLLDDLQQNDPDLARELKDKLYTFEELGNLTIKELRLVLSEVSNEMTLALSLRGAGEDLRRHFFSAMSRNRAADIADLIQSMDPTPIREINKAKKQVLDIARRLDGAGLLVLKKEKEEFID